MAGDVDPTGRPNRLGANRVDALGVVACGGARANSREASMTKGGLGKPSGLGGRSLRGRPGVGHRADSSDCNTVVVAPPTVATACT
jgi:hypothetical protein